MENQKDEEMLFEEPIVIKDVDEQFYEETIEDMIADESIVTRSVVKGAIGFVSGIKWLGSQITRGVGFLQKRFGTGVKKFFTVYLKRFFTVYLVNFFKKFAIVTRLYKLKPYITYSNMLGVAIIISTAVLLAMCIIQVRFKDTESEVAQTESSTTYNDIKDIYGDGGEQSLNLSDGTIMYAYRNQTLADIKCDIHYKIKPDTNKLMAIYIQFKKNIFDTRKMRNYLKINYGKPKVEKVGGVWEYEGEDIAYVFSNNTLYDYEQVIISYKENAHTEEEIKKYNEMINGDKITKDKSDKKKEDKEDIEEDKSSEKKEDKEDDEEDKSSEKKEDKEDDEEDKSDEKKEDKEDDKEDKSKDNK